MLSKRDKLLLQPWDERRFKNHRTKVSSALPSIDDAPPPNRPHVTVKLKKNQKEEDRKAKIEKDNFNLLQRLSIIMKVNRLDNHWLKPQPDFHHKVGLYFSVEDMNKKLKLSRTSSAEENSILSCRNVKCFACEMKKNKTKETDALQLSGRCKEPLPPLF